MTDRSDYLPSARLQELAKNVDPKLKLEPEAEQACSPRLSHSDRHADVWPSVRPDTWQVLQDVADDFVENLAAFACELALHRSGTTLEARDVQLALGALLSHHFASIVLAK